MKKISFLSAVGLTALTAMILSFKAKDPNSVIYIADVNGFCTIGIGNLTTIENPPNATITLPSASTEFNGYCTTLEVWFTL